MKSETVFFLKNIPGIKSLLASHAWQSCRHKISLLCNRRENSTFTGFLRLPTQFEALAGPVVDYILSGNRDKEVKTIVMGCSNGAEAYTIASVLKKKIPHGIFSVHAYDIDEGMIEKAKGARYLGEEVLNNKVITEEFIRQTFDIRDGSYEIKRSVGGNVFFDIADALDPDLREKIGIGDIVFAQNFLLHMKPAQARKAFDNICDLLDKKAALFIDGIDLNIRYKGTKSKNLKPLDYKIRQIHNEARRARGVGWPYHYWGLEEFTETRHQWRQWYATVFLR